MFEKELKDLENLTKSIGGLANLGESLKNKIVSESGLNASGQTKVHEVLNSLNLEKLSNQNLTDEQLQTIIKSKIDAN